MTLIYLFSKYGAILDLMGVGEGVVADVPVCGEGCSRCCLRCLAEGWSHAICGGIESLLGCLLEVAGYCFAPFDEGAEDPRHFCQALAACIGGLKELLYIKNIGSSGCAAH